MDRNSKLFGQILLSMIPALVSGFFAYKIAVVESKTNIKDTSTKADTGYTTMVSAVEKLQTQVETLTLENAEMKGYLKGLKVGGSSSPPPAHAEYKRFDMPKNLDRAWEQRSLPLESKKK